MKRTQLILAGIVMLLIGLVPSPAGAASAAPPPPPPPPPPTWCPPTTPGNTTITPSGPGQFMLTIVAMPVIWDCNLTPPQSSAGAPFIAVSFYSATGVALNAGPTPDFQGEPGSSYTVSGLTSGALYTMNMSFYFVYWSEGSPVGWWSPWIGWTPYLQAG